MLWNLDLANVYITTSSAQRTIFFSPAKITVKRMEQNLDLAKSSYNEHNWQAQR